MKLGDTEAKVGQNVVSEAEFGLDYTYRLLAHILARILVAKPCDKTGDVSPHSIWLF